MNIRPKTVRRLIILILVCSVVVAAGASVLYLSRQSHQRQILAARTEGMEAFKSGDYAKALDRLHPYVAGHPQDYDAMYALAVSRNRIETARGHNIIEAKQYFEQLHNERPDDMQVSHNLLQIYDRLSYLTEASRVANEVLARDPKDVQALRVKASVLARTSRPLDALAVSQKLNDTDPLDLDGQIQTLNLMRTLKRSPDEIVQHFQALQKAHPDDPRFELLLGQAYANAQDETNTLKWLRSAAQRTPPDAAFVQRLSQDFDDLKLFSESRDLLERAAAGGKDPEITKVLIERLWQDGRYQDVVDRLHDVTADSAGADADLLAFKALSLSQLGQKDQSDAIIIALQNHHGDNKAAAWAAAMTTRGTPATAPRDAITQYQADLARDPENAVIRCWIGESYLQLGETDLAIQQWKQSAELMPSWAHPCVLLACAESSAGQTEQAFDSAAEAYHRSPNLVEAHIEMGIASYLRLQKNPDAVDRATLIKFLADIQRAIPCEPQTLPLLAELQAEAGQRADAIATIRSAVAPNQMPGNDLLLRLIDLSRRDNLGLDSELAARLPADASGSPRLALQRALDAARAGKSTEGLDLLTKAAAAAKDQPLQWKLAIAQYRESTGDPGAKAAWIALGDANPNDVAVQNLILQAARSALTDRDFFSRTIDRLHSLTGDDAIGWRLARARFLLSSPDKQRDSAEAVDILHTLTNESPDMPEYRVLLAAGLINLGDTNGAIGHLKAAVDHEGANVEAIIQLSSLLAAQNRTDEARSYLDRAAKMSELSPANRTEIARLLAQRGQMQQAIDLLKPAQDSLDPAGLLLLAEMLRSRGAASDAEAIYNKLLNDPAVTADAISSAADFFASSGRFDRAKQVIAKLSDAHITPVDRALRTARFDEAFAGKDDARKQLLDATTQAPTNVDAWRALVEFYIRQNQFKDASSAADSALAKLPGNDALVTLKAQANALQSSAGGQSDLGPLIDALSKDPANAAEVGMLKALQDAKQSKQPISQIAAKLKSLADKYPNYYPLQWRLAEAYGGAGDLNDAAIVAERLIDARPNDPAPAHLAADIYRSAQRWSDMKRAADLWRQRSMEHPADADIAMAQAMLELGDNAGAAIQLAPYFDSAATSPQQNFNLTATVAQLQVQTGQFAQAKAMLQPLLSQGPRWRRLWMMLAAHDVTPAPAASEWLRTGAAAIPDSAAPEQFALAQAWQEMGTRLNNADAIAQARQLVEGLADQKELGAAPVMMLAGIDTTAGDLTSAEKLYRKALTIDPNLPDALNNVAYIILQRGGDLNEAKDDVTRAIALREDASAFHDTLARIEEKQKHPDVALTEFQNAVRLNPASVPARIGLCRVLSASGQRDKAAQELQHIDTQLGGNPPQDESVRHELQSVRESLSSSGAGE